MIGNIGDVHQYACASCHDSKAWFVDTRSNPNNLSVGAANITKRNSPSMVNVAYYTWGGWGGAQDQFWKQGSNSPETKDLNGNRLAIAHVISTYYRADYNAVFGEAYGPLELELDNTTRFPPSGKPGDPAWDGMSAGDKEIVNRIMSNIGKSLEAYERHLISSDAPFDRYAAGDFSALTTSAKRGLKLFLGKAGCDKCHSGSTFSDQDFHNTAVKQPVEPDKYDNGRFDDVPRLQNPFNGAGIYSDDVAAGQTKLQGIVQTETMRGQFRTKSLRHVAETGPYFHNGSVTTLEEVIRFYNDGGSTEGSYPGQKDTAMMPLNLTETEMLDIVAFLKSLTGQPVPDTYTIDTSASTAMMSTDRRSATLAP